MTLARGVRTLILFSICTFRGSVFAQIGNQALPRLVHENGRHALMVDGAPYLVLGAQINNSSAWPEMLPKF